MMQLLLLQGDFASAAVAAACTADDDVLLIGPLVSYM